MAQLPPPRLDQFAQDILNQSFAQAPISPEIVQRFGGGMSMQQPQIAPPQVQQYAQPQMVQQPAPRQLQADPMRMQYNQLVEQRFNELVNGFGGIENVMRVNRLKQFRDAAAQDVEMVFGKAPEPQQPVRVMDIDGTRIAAGGDLRAPVVLPTGIEQQTQQVGLQKALLDLKKAEQELSFAQQKAQDESSKRALELQTSFDDSVKAISMIDELLYDPALASGVGVRRYLSIFPETKAKELKSKIDQIKGDVFMRVYERLKGGGQITEIESAKASKSKERLDPELSVDDFRKALLDLRETYMGFTGKAAKGLQAFAPQAQQQVAPQAQGQQPQAQSLPPSAAIPNDGRPIISVEPPTPGQPVVIPQLPPEPMQITNPDGSVSVPRPSGIRWTRDASGKPVMVPRG